MSHGNHRHYGYCFSKWWWPSSRLARLYWYHCFSVGRTPQSVSLKKTMLLFYFQKVLIVISNFCVCSIAVGMIIKIIVMCPIQHYKYRDGIDNLLVLLIGGIPMQMPTIPFILYHVPFQS
ncbi:hypothetical protein PVL29_008056 [Vitis rotundifolia]|uniref:Uncharacterized protein n=1 Tax=Vitis rotundifolia TaxID=103349 RepID=A0AA39A1K8_VITRO|nr:hypothetical protein PVL29_008054 [Vitis rotundifolia]KAJ9699272.1 hypothetical protein PVL29_008056 [Vitis rotundifolia]